MSGTVRVWTVDLDARTAGAFGDGPWSDEERGHASRLRGEDLRRRYLAGRASLREILSVYLGRRAQDVPLRVGERGRPELAIEGLDFNVSHSENLFLCAVHEGGRVGVDVERVRPMEDLSELAELGLSAVERRRIEGLQGDAALRAFFRAWTAREALAKCLGLGLELSPEDVRPERDSARILARTAEGLLWEIVELDPAPGFVAAVAVLDPAPPVEVRSWDASLAVL